MLRKKYQSNISKDKELIESYINDLRKEVTLLINAIDIPDTYDDSDIKVKLSNKVELEQVMDLINAIVIPEEPDLAPIFKKLNQLDLIVHSINIPKIPEPISLKGLVSEDELKNKLRALRLALEADIAKKMKNLSNGGAAIRRSTRSDVTGDYRTVDDKIVVVTNGVITAIVSTDFTNEFTNEFA